MKTGTYMHEAKNVSAILGRKSDVSVVFAGDEAATNGKIIQLPSVNEQKEMTEQEVAIARGYVDHEAAHVKWTTKDYSRAMKAAVERAADKDKELVRSTINALEDVRIEKHLLDTYAGCKDNLSAVADSVVEPLLERLSAEDKTLGDVPAREVGPLSMTWYGRGCSSYGVKGAEAFTQLDATVQQQVIDVMAGLNKNTSAEELIRMAEQYVQMLNMEEQEKEEEEKEEEKEQQEKRESIGGSKGESGKESTEGEERTEVGEGCESTEATESQTLDPDKMKARVMKQALGAYDNTVSGDFYRRVTDKKDTVYTKEQLKVDDNRFKDVVTSLTGQINVVRRRLERMLMARMKRDWRGGKLQGRLDTRRLVGAYGCEENVYKMREEDDELDTAVSIAVDHSGSMSGCRIALAQKATIALAEALEPTPIKLAISGFKTELLDREDQATYLAGHYSSASPVAIFKYKDFDEGIHRCRGSLGGMIRSRSHVGGIHNIDGVSVHKIGRELMARPERRKVLIVLSDGLPEDDLMDEAQMNSHLKSVVKELNKGGVEVFGIGIQSSAVKRFYDNCVVLHDASELDKELIDRMSKVLIGGEWNARRVAS